MTKLLYNGVDFDDFDASGQVSIGSSGSKADGVSQGRSYTITVEGYLKVAPNTDIATAQTQFRSDVNELFDLPDGSETSRVPLVYKSNDGSVFWAFDSPGDANNRMTTGGISMSIDFPWGPASHASNHPYRITWTAQVDTCPGSVDGVAGIAWWSQSYSVTRERGVPIGFAFEASVRLCYGFDCEDVLTDILDTVAKPLLEQITGHSPIPAPDSERTTHSHASRTCSVAWSWGEAGGSAGGSAESRRIRRTCQISIDQNLGTARFSLEAPFDGPVGNGPAGSSASPIGTSLGLGPFGSVAGGVGTAPILRGSITTGSTDFKSVQKSVTARKHWTDWQEWLPDGAGDPYLPSEPVWNIDEDAGVIRLEWTAYFNWIHGKALLKYEEGLDIDIGHPTTSHTPCALTPAQAAAITGTGSPAVGTAAAPAPYDQHGGRSVTRITYRITIWSREKFQRPKLRLAPAGDNIWLVRSPSSFKQRRIDGFKTGPGSPSTKANIYEFTMTQEFEVREPANLPTIIEPLDLVRAQVEDATVL